MTYVCQESTDGAELFSWVTPQKIEHITLHANEPTWEKLLPQMQNFYRQAVILTFLGKSRGQTALQMLPAG